MCSCMRGSPGTAHLVRLLVPPAHPTVLIALISLAGRQCLAIALCESSLTVKKKKQEIPC